MFSNVKKNKFGFYELIDKPSPEELSLYYANKYFQEAKGGYEKSYSKEEVQYINNKIAQKYRVISKLLDMSDTIKMQFLDVGCGEGWALSTSTTKDGQ
ncbi:MAG: hypothetical protein M1609_17970 [Firmicutes bacterium]|nr:hypothetical protein [Bacillota bacterium]